MSFPFPSLSPAPIHNESGKGTSFSSSFMDPLVSSRQFLKIILIGESGLVIGWCR